MRILLYFFTALTFLVSSNAFARELTPYESRSDCLQQARAGYLEVDDCYNGGGGPGVTYCFPAPSTSNAASTRSNFYYSYGQCTIRILPLTCNSGYSLSNAGTPQAACLRAATPQCSTQPSTANATAMEPNYLYSAENCIIRSLPTACTRGYTLENPRTPNARCAEALRTPPCSPQPSLLHSTSHKADYLYASGNCTIQSLPVACESGYNLAYANTNRAACVKAPNCSTQPSTANATSTSSSDYFYNGCWVVNSYPTACKTGYALQNGGTNTVGCVQSAPCSTQPSTANATTTSSNVFYAAGNCWLNTLPTACKTGFDLKNAGRPTATCTPAATCSPQPSMANSITASSNVYYAGGNCNVITMPTGCITGYSLAHAGTNRAVCNRLPNCSAQPSTANATKTISNYYSSGSSCWISTLPTECKLGYVLQNANSTKAACVRAAACNIKAPVTNASNTSNTDIFVDGCWLTSSYATGCNAGYTLKDAGKKTVRCEKSGACATQPNLTGVSKTESDIYYAAGKCWLNKIPTECSLGHLLKSKGTPNAHCEKAALCKNKPSITNSSKKTTNFFYEKDKCFLSEIPLECMKGYALKYDGTDKARCEKTKLCRKSSTKNVKKFKADFFYEKKKCLIKQLAVECEKGYELKYKNSDRAKCSKKRTSSKR